jgi:hypothetical protein
MAAGVGVGPALQLPHRYRLTDGLVDNLLPEVAEVKHW